MFKFFKKQIRVEVVRRKENQLTMQDWRSDPALCVLAAKTLADPNLQLMISVLRNESPTKHVLDYHASLDARAMMQARGEGYEMFLNNLEALTVTTAPTLMPEAAFAPSE